MRRLTAALFALFGLAGFQTAFADCTAQMGDINFGNIDLLNPGSVTAQATIRVSCKKTNWFSAQTFNICLGVDGGRTGGSTQLNPRHMCAGGVCSDNNRLAFNLYTDAARNVIWGTRGRSPTETLNTSITIYPLEGEKTQEMTVYAQLITPLGNVPPGQYVNDFTAPSTTALWFTTANNCRRQITAQGRFPFTVNANIIKNCTVSAPSDIDFGTAHPADTNLEGRTSFNVSCTSGTPYAIGLSPSNSNTRGEGEMAAVAAGNNDRIPYRLRTGSGTGGAAWGNIPGSSGNRVNGTGTGLPQNYTVYAAVPAADYHYGSYKDTVTVQVTY